MNRLQLYLAQLDEPQAQADAGALTDAINTVLGVAGIIAVIFVLIGGFRYVISAGDAQKISQAKDTILYAIIGAIVAGTAFIIVNFLLDELAAAPSDYNQEKIVQTINHKDDIDQMIYYFTPVAFAGSHEFCPDNVASNEICNPSSTFSDLAETVINILSYIVGAAAVIMIIVGGLRYVVSGGDQQAVTAAKNTILYAIIGLVIAGLAQLIVQFVLDRL